MPVMLMLAAICAGLTSAVIWLALGGSSLMAFALYVLSGHLVLAGMLSFAAMRGLR